MNILFISDIVGEEVLDIILDILPRLKNYHKIDFIIANVENTDKGKGITSSQIERLKSAGINCLTSGNHIWEPRKKDVLIKYAGYLLRPLNYPDGNLGIGSTVISLPDIRKVGIINIQGRSFMYTINCPFTTVQKEIFALRPKKLLKISRKTGKAWNRLHWQISLTFTLKSINVTRKLPESM